MSLSLSGGAKSYVGLDLSNTSAKVVELKPSGKSWRLTAFGVKPLPKDAVQDRQVKNVEAVGQVIQELFKEAGISARRVASSISGTSVIIKKIQVPKMTEMDLEDQIGLEAEEYIPYDIADVYLDFQILGQNEENQDVLLVACKKEIVDEHLKAFAGAGLTCGLMDVDLFAVENAYELLMQGKSPGSLALINAGETLTNINILHQGVSAFTRDQFFGTRNLLEDIQMQLGLELEEALEVLHGKKNLPDYGATVLTPFLEQFATQVNQSLDFYKSTQPDHTVEKILLSGGCALVEGVAEYLNRATQVPVEIADPLRYIQVAKGADKNGELSRLSPMLMVPLGLALRGGES